MIKIITYTIFGGFFLLCFQANTSAQYTSTISGTIFNSQNNRPVEGLRVELLNDVYSTIASQKTEGSGRYFFNRLSAGNYKIKVLTLGTNFLEQTQDTSIVTFSIGSRTSTDNVYLDIYLKYDPLKVDLSSTNAGQSIFVQDIPKEALVTFQKGVSQLGEKNDAGLTTIENSIKIFPEYYDALDLLGNQYVERKEFAKALPFLIKAIDVNQRSFSSFYALGFACFSLNKRSESLEAMRAATILRPDSVNAVFWYGRILRMEGKYEDAEKYLNKAKLLSKKSPVPDIHWQLALLDEKLQKYKEAAAELEIFIKLQPNSRDTEKIKKLIEMLKAKSKQ